METAEGGARPSLADFLKDAAEANFAEINAANIQILLALAVAKGLRHPAAWAIVLLTKVSPGIGLLWFLVRHEWRNLAIALAVTALAGPRVRGVAGWVLLALGVPLVVWAGHFDGDVSYAIGQLLAMGIVVVVGVIAIDTKGSYLRTEKQLTAVIGIKDAIVVVTADAVLVADKAHDQQVKQLVERMKAAGRSEATAQARTYRPWGWFQTMDEGHRFKVKRICVKAGAQLSLQKHFHRAEHWVVVRGTADR